jgi:non-specific serine/threonine protein kinase
VPINKRNYPYFTVEAGAEADENADVFPGKVEKLDLSKYVETERYNDEDKQLLNEVRKYKTGNQ